MLCSFTVVVGCAVVVKAATDGAHGCSAWVARATSRVNMWHWRPRICGTALHGLQVAWAPELPLAHTACMIRGTGSHSHHQLRTGLPLHCERTSTTNTSASTSTTYTSISDGTTNTGLPDASATYSLSSTTLDRWIWKITWVFKAYCCWTQYTWDLNKVLTKM